MGKSSTLSTIKVIFVLFAIACQLQGLFATITITSKTVVFVDGDPKPGAPYDKDHYKSYKEFCEGQKLRRDSPEKIDKDDCKRTGELDFHTDDLTILFMGFAVVLYGAVVRSILRFFEVSVPFTVFMMVSGMIVGLVAKYFCYELYTYTALARCNAKVYLFVFLPVLLFESSFSISGHVFMKAVGQVLLLAAPGMVLCTVLTAFVCKTFFIRYEWSFVECLFFGCIISATDPVAVVAILKELGVSEQLSVIVDGESLLNDGIAILLYEVIRGILDEDVPDHEDIEALILHVFEEFVQIAIGGPVFGFLMAKIAIFCLSRVFNDPIVEITVTLVATYLTYYIGEAVLKVSGVMAIVILGITMSSEKTCISPETEHEMHAFWEMLGHLANTVLFFITGVIITERGTRGASMEDVYYLVLLYCALNLIRFLMLLLFSPILSRIGYGLPWQNMIVLMWGGLRGAVGICLSLEVYEDKSFCKKSIGPKVLLQTAGIVFLTLVVNGTTTKKLLQVLELTAISAGRMEEMRNAVKTLHVVQKKALLMLRHDRFLADANWAYVAEKSRIDDPYKNKLSREKKPPENTSLVSLSPEQYLNECPECKTHVPNLPTNDELRIMTDEGRLRVIKAMKISYWSHFEQGTLTEVAVRILADTADNCTDKELYMIHTRDLRKHWQIRGIFPWIRSQLVQHIGEVKTITSIPPAPDAKWRKGLWKFVTSACFEYTMVLIVIVNMIPIIWQLALEIAIDTCEEMDPRLAKMDIVFKIVNVAFTCVYTGEFILKLIGLGLGGYCSSKWNWLDFIILLISYADLALTYIDFCSSKSTVPRHMLKVVKIVRCVRALKILRVLTPLLMDTVNGKINSQLFLGYDVALGYIMGCDDVLKFLPHMIDNKRVYNKLRTSIEKERMEAVREMGMLQKNHPGIAVAIKTRHASRSVLNQMKSTLTDLRADGLLDEKENDLLTLAIDDRMKNLLFSPNYIAPPAPEVLLENLNWVYGHPELRNFIFDNATLLQYEVNDVIYATGDPPMGIYVIVSGMVRMRYEPDVNIKTDRELYGSIPAMEIFKDFDFDKPTEDLFYSGTVIGESACMTGRSRAASVICETEGVTAFHIPLTAIEKALATFTDRYNSLEERLWRSCGMRRSSWFLPSNPFYQAYSKEKIDTIVERSCVPIGPEFEYLPVPSYVQDLIVIEGWVEDPQTGITYKAPAVVPRTIPAVRMPYNPGTVNRVLVVLAEDANPDPNDPSPLATCMNTAASNRKASVEETPPEEDEEFNPLKKKRRVSVAVNFGVQKSKRKSTGQISTSLKRRLSASQSPGEEDEEEEEEDEE